MIQIGGVYTTFCQEDGILLQKYAIEMGGVSRYFSKVSGSGVASTLLILASRDVIISGQTCGSKLQRVFTFGDACWLPKLSQYPVAVFYCSGTLIFLSLLFWKKQGKPPKKARTSLHAEPLKSLGKKGKTLKKARKFLAT